MNHKRLQSFGFVLIALGLLALGLNFQARRAARQETDALSSRIDAISVQVDAIRDAPSPNLESSSVAGSLEDVHGDLLGVKQSHDSPFSILNLSFFAYAILMISGSAMTILAASRRGAGVPNTDG